MDRNEGVAPKEFKALVLLEVLEMVVSWLKKIFSLLSSTSRGPIMRTTPIMLLRFEISIR
jgi:hypothetical protein